MTAFMGRRTKKYRFAVRLTLEGLSSVPYINGLLHAKVRLMDGGFVAVTSGQEVVDHKVRWDSKFDMECKMSANASNGVLNSCLLRISVRKDGGGRRSPDKLGYVDMDLTEFAGAGLTCKRCLLDAYSNSQRRCDNSSLKVSVEMTLLSGDPLFKRPTTSGSSSFHAPLLLPPLGLDDANGRVDATRINPEDVVQELVASSLCQQVIAEEESLDDDVGLQLFVRQDGSATLVSRDDRNTIRHERRPPA